MNRSILLFACIFILQANLFAQQEDFNLELLSKVTYPEGCNDIWGYVDENGIEYAIMGTRTATVVISLEDPRNPVELFRKDGSQSTWRDIKTFQDHAYVTTDDGSDGLLIIDLGDVDNITGEYQKTAFTLGGRNFELDRCHNIYIDTLTGHMFLSGCNTGANGVLIFDLNQDLDNPVFLGAERRFYSHDNMVKGDTLYTSDLTQGLSIWDVSDPANPVELGRKTTTSNFTHNAWVSTDNKYIFTTDETGDAYVDAYDVSDPANIEFLDAYRPVSTENRGVIPHNTHYHEGYLVTSWYTDGVKVLDGSRPHNLIEVGSYDSWLGADGGFNGCWGAYPWLPSGIVLGSDIQEGLLVLQPTYVRGCYLEGTITNNLDFSGVPGVTVEISSTFENSESSDLEGGYATGQAEAGTFNVTYSHPDYKDTTLQVELINGVVTIQDVELRAKPFFRINIDVVDKETKMGIPNAELLLINDFRDESMQTDSDGNLELIVFEDQSNVYNLYAGKWGYLHGVLEDIDLKIGTSYTVELETGYQDDFILEQGWTVTGDAPRGIWERGIPIGTTVNGAIANPILDVETDLGDQCYVTGNGGGNAGQDDVDEGVTILTSPIMDLTQIKNPVVIFKSWFFNGSRPNPNDSLRVLIDNGVDQEVVYVDNTSSSAWSDTITIMVEEWLSLTDSMRLIVEVSDDFTNGHVVEGGFDEFRVMGERTTNNNTVTNEGLNIWPTVTTSNLNISGLKDQHEWIRILAQDGRTVQYKKLTGRTGTMELAVDALPAGSYNVQVGSGNHMTPLTFIKI